MRRVSPGQGPARRRAQAQLLGAQGVDPHRAVAQLGDLARPAEAQLVEAAVAVHDERALGAELQEHMGQGLHPLRGVDADHLAPHPGGVRERPEQVEQGAHAELPARRDGVACGGVVGRGEQEGDADLFSAARELLRGQLQVHTQSLQHVRRARAARHRPVAVLGHGGPGRGGQQGGARREVEGARLVTPGAAGVHGVEVWAERHPEGVAAHHPGGGGDLADRLALGPQGDQEARRGRGAERPGQQRLHHPLDLLRVQLLTAQEPL